ncbi:unnamed protein product [Urochloa decumbens]|uniref:KIB1-4 beta-propeller domain-containing protein n=1 Tax=Urochloa decumbens TaxID=240449 RepID=A0ABC9CMA7_9POAL
MPSNFPLLAMNGHGPTKAVAAAAATSTSRTGGPAELPLHLTEKILYGISPLATARLATVCKSWAAAVSERLARPVPHLFVNLPPDINCSGRRGAVVSVSLDAGGGGHPPAVIPSRVRLADTNGLRCVGALPSGHLAFANFCWCETTVLLVNPVTGARRTVHVDRLRQINPVLAAGGGADSDSFISVGDAGELLIWRRRTTAGAGGEEKWSKSAAAASGHRTYAITSVASCNGCFYMMDWEGNVFAVDAAAPPPLRVEKVTAASLFEQFSLAPPCPSAAAAMGHLVECGGEVLFVRRVLLASSKKDDDHRGVLAFCDHDVDDHHPSVVGFEVYRLDVAGRRWTEVRKLAGDRALFVSQGSSFAVRSSETEGCRSNCIYFLDEKRYCALCNRDDGNTWGVYSMEDRKVLFKHAITGDGACSSATWFLPRVEV